MASTPETFLPDATMVAKESPGLCPHGFLPVAALLLVVCTSVSARDVWVVTDRQHPVTSVDGARITELDAPQHLLTERFATLPADPTRATAVARQRLSEGGPVLQRQLADAYQAVADAWALGIARIPAVVVDRRYVVYGESDVARAMDRIEAYRRVHP